MNSNKIILASIFNPLKWPRSHQTAALCVLAIVLPVLWFGPWIPFVDLIAYTGINSYPPKLSYGPNHYYLLQATYILAVVLSRACVDLGISVPIEVALFYLGEALVFFGVMWRLMEMFVPHALTRQIFLILGILAFWDGLYLWGGPFSYAFGSTLLTIPFWLTLREASDPSRTSIWPVSVMVLLAVASHPFALIHGVILFFLRLLFLPRNRWQSVLMLVVLFFYQLIIRSENPEKEPGSVVAVLFNWYPDQLLSRIFDLFDWNNIAVHYLFGTQPTLLFIYFIFIGLVHLLGFVCSPIVAWLAREAPALRMLALLNSIVFILYLFANDNEYITFWPERILGAYSYVTYVAGIAMPLYLLNHWHFWRPVETETAPDRRPWLRRALLAAALVFMLAAEAPILQLGNAVEINYRHLRQTLFDTGVHDCILITSRPGIQIAPFYLRCEPFILFSDPAVIERHILIFTEWHVFGRHPTRLPEVDLDMRTRPRYLADFYTDENGLVSVRLKQMK
jgi:hypothetical protein